MKYCRFKESKAYEFNRAYIIYLFISRYITKTNEVNSKNMSWTKDIDKFT